MMYVFDLEPVHHCVHSKDNETISAVVGSLENGEAFICSETSNTLKEMDNADRDFVRQLPKEATLLASDDDHECTALVARKINGFNGFRRLSANQRQRYVMMLAKAIRMGATLVFYEPQQRRFSISQACECLEIPCMSMSAFVAAYIE